MARDPVSHPYNSRLSLCFTPSNSTPGRTTQKILGRPSTGVQRILFYLTRGYEEILQTSHLEEWETKQKKKFEPGLAHLKKKKKKSRFLK